MIHPEARVAEYTDIWPKVTEEIITAVSTARNIIERPSLHHLSPEAKFALLSTLTTTTVYRNLIGTPEARAKLCKELLLIDGGPADNPYFELDEVGNRALAHIAATYSDVVKAGIVFFTEESDGYQTAKNSLIRFPQKKLLVAIDGLDESKTVATDCYHQSFGMVIADESGRILTGAIGSYVDDRILVTERGQSWFFHYDGKKLLVNGKPNPYRPSERFHYAMLPKSTRTKIMDGTGFAHNHTWEEETFGGWAVLEVLSGNLDLLIDPYGQKVHEASYWGANAQAAGLSVTDLQGQPYDFDKIFPLIRSGEKPRLPIIIARPEILECILPELAEVNDRRQAFVASS